jgi:hypothetical protein
MYSYVVSNDSSKYININTTVLGVSGIVCSPAAVEKFLENSK